MTIGSTTNRSRAGHGAMPKRRPRPAHTPPRTAPRAVGPGPAGRRSGGCRSWCEYVLRSVPGVRLLPQLCAAGDGPHHRVNPWPDPRMTCREADRVRPRCGGRRTCRAGGDLRAGRIRHPEGEGAAKLVVSHRAAQLSSITGPSRARAFARVAGQKGGPERTMTTRPPRAGERRTGGTDVVDDAHVSRSEADDRVDPRIPSSLCTSTRQLPDGSRPRCCSCAAAGEATAAPPRATPPAAIPALRSTLRRPTDCSLIGSSTSVRPPSRCCSPVRRPARPRRAPDLGSRHRCRALRGPVAWLGWEWPISTRGRWVPTTWRTSRPVRGSAQHAPLLVHRPLARAAAGSPWAG